MIACSSYYRDGWEQGATRILRGPFPVHEIEAKAVGSNQIDKGGSFR
ncbi:hypothetical protein ACX12E_10520 [Paenibacillus vandeheii]